MSLAGHIPEPPGAPRSVRHMGVVGPLACSIEDLSLALGLIAGEDGRSWEVPPVSVAPVPRRSLQTCRVAWTGDFGVPVTQDTRAALETVAGDLARAGCHVERSSPPGFDFDGAWETWGEMLGSEIGASMAPIPRLLTGMQFRSMPGTSILKRGYLRGLRLNMPRYVQMLTRRDGLISTLETFLSEWDAWLCPVAVVPAFTHRKTGQPIEVDGQPAPYFVASMSYTTVFNVTGNPVVVLPVGRSKDGLPIGIQVVGRRWRDMELLAVAEALTEVTGPFQRPPGY